MNFLCERIGFFLKQGCSSQDVKIYYFYINDEFQICYCRNYAYLEKIFKESESINDINTTIMKRNLKFINFEKCKVNNIQPFPSLEFVPFPNRNCFELNLNPAVKKIKQILIFALFDDNIFFLFDFIKNYNSIIRKSIASRLTSNKESQFKKYSPDKEEDSTQEEYEKKFQLIMALYNEKKNNKEQEEEAEKKNPEGENEINSEGEKIETIVLKNGSTYSGQTRNGKPHGKGAEFRQDKLTYNGDFKNGKWHGVGYIVDSNLDVCEGEFIEGELVGF